MKEMNVYTLCEHGAMNEHGLTTFGTRWVSTNKGDAQHPFIVARIGCSGDEDNDGYEFDGHAYDICFDPTC